MLLDPKRSKNGYRKAQALKGLQILDLALEELEHVRDDTDQNLQIQKLKDAIRDLQNQCRPDNHSDTLDKVYKSYFCQNKHDLQQIVDYFGPIKIGLAPDGTRRGLVATQNIEQGDLILIERALEFLDGDEKADEELYWIYNDVSKIKHNEQILLSPEKSALFDKLQKKLQHCKPSHIKVQQMYRGQ